LSGAGHVIRQRLREELEGLSARDDQRLEVALRPLAELLMGKIGEAREELSA
jgi:hypothetical protein